MIVDLYYSLTRTTLRGDCHGCVSAVTLRDRDLSFFQAHLARTASGNQVPGNATPTDTCVFPNPIFAGLDSNI